jgi:microcystin degradation protein MlrC
MIQLPIAISIEQQLTEKNPCKQILDLIQELYLTKSILSISLVLGFPYADVEDMGSSLIVVSDNDLQQANDTASFISDKIIAIKHQFNAEKKDINSQVLLLQKMQKPVLLLDMGDNVGGGSDGNSTAILDAIEEHGYGKTFICIHDPEAVVSASMSNIGDKLDLKIGIIPDTGISSEYQVTILDKCEGAFSEDVPRHGGQLHFNMGKIVVVQTEKGNTIMLTSLRVPPYSIRQITAFKLIPENFDAIVAKGVNAPIAAYKDVCKTILQVNTPGPTQADMTQFQFQNRRKPLFPFEP